MKAAVLENGKFVIKELEKPSLAEYKTGAIVKVSGCGLCGSDIVKMRCGTAKDGTVLGHEVVGIIEEINSSTDFTKGQRIALGHHIPCFSCRYCFGGNYSMCRHFKSTNIRPGGFCEYIYVSEEHLQNTVFAVNDDMTDVEASFLEPLGCCIRAVKRARLTDNSKNLILGLGSVGLLMGQTVKAFGHEVYGIDLLPQRAVLSEKYGFDKSFALSGDENEIENIKSRYAPIGFDSAFLTAGASSSLDLAVKSVRDGGTIIVFSSIKDENAFKNNDIYYRELTVTGSYSPSPIDLEDSMNLLSSRKVNVDGISTEYSLQDLNTAFNHTVSNKIMKAYIKL